MKINFFIHRGSNEHVTQKRFMDVTRAINGNIEFGNTKDGGININGSWQKVVTPGAPDTEFTLTHNLGRVPEGILVVSLDQAAIIYASRKSSWSQTQLFLKCNVASVALTGFVI